MMIESLVVFILLDIKTHLYKVFLAVGPMNAEVSEMKHPENGSLLGYLDSDLCSDGQIKQVGRKLTRVVAFELRVGHKST